MFYAMLQCLPCTATSLHIYIAVFVAYATRVNPSRIVHVILLLLSIYDAIIYNIVHIITIEATINTHGVCDNPSFGEQKRIII